MAKITINGQTIKAKKGTSILNAAKSIGIEIPTLCFIAEINEIGFCRICVVEVEGEQDLVSACNTEVANGMVIHTESEKVINSRRTSLQLLASKHRFDCWSCPKDGMCEFYDMLKEHNIVFEEFGPSKGRYPDQILGTAISQDQTKWVLCKRCVAVCNEVVTARVLKFRDDDGLNPVVSPTPGLSFDESGCIGCGHCVQACPTGTLFETEHIDPVEKLLKDRKTTVVAQMNEEAAVMLAEEFGYEVESTLAPDVKASYHALELIGFDEVVDINTAKDIHVLEQSNILMARLEKDVQSPLITSHCPAAVRYTELYNQEMIENLAPNKSPHIIQGALIKNLLAKKTLSQKAEDVKVVSILSCNAAKAEIAREQLAQNGVKDVDFVLTVRELARMMKRRGHDLQTVTASEPKGKLHTVLSNGTRYQGSRSTLENVLNHTNKQLEGKDLAPIKYKVIAGDETKASEGLIKEATVLVNGKKINIAVVNGGAKMRDFYKTLETTKKKYHYVEVMACPGACANGGGAPYNHDISTHEVIKNRLETLFDGQGDMTTNQAVKNTEKLYQEYLDKPGSGVVTKYFETTFSPKEFTKE